MRALFIINAADSLDEIRSVPSYTHFKQRSDGYHSIRLNKQWRVLFLWKDDGAHSVMICDPH